MTQAPTSGGRLLAFPGVCLEALEARGAPGAVPPASRAERELERLRHHLGLTAAQATVLDADAKALAQHVRRALRPGHPAAERADALVSDLLLRSMLLTGELTALAEGSAILLDEPDEPSGA
jgi:hypothetical protein